MSFACLTIGLTQEDRIARLSKVNKVSALHGLAVFHVQTRDDAFGKTIVHFISSFLSRCEWAKASRSIFPS